MFNLPTPAQLLAFQIDWYTNRLKEATRIEERAFLRKTLFQLKQRNNETTAKYDIHNRVWDMRNTSTYHVDRSGLLFKIN